MSEIRQKLRVWHVPQLPCKAFRVEVESVAEGVKLMNTLANYDQFQLDNNIKPDYCNTNGLEMYDESLSDEDLIDMELEDRWVSWYYEQDDEYFEEPEEYLKWLASKA